VATSFASARPALAWIAAGIVLLVWALPDLVLLVGYAVLLAYALLPIVSALERVRLGRGQPVSRAGAAAIVMLGLVVLAVLSLALTIPRLAAEAAHFATRVPAGATLLIEGVRAWVESRGLGPSLDPVIDGLRTNASGLLQNLGSAVARALGWLFGGIGQALGLAILPLLAFYLLADADAVRASALGFVPVEARGEIVRLGGAVDRALRSYVRGQALVCLVMAVATGGALALVHFPLALLLGVLVGIAELIPYLGFAIAAAAIALTGLSASPFHALLGVLLYAGINWAIGTFVTPRVMGRYLKMHPFVVTVSVLAGAKLLGPAGALLALPGAAVIQAVVGELAPHEPRAG
jgi:predicted PurR-regulated permease PerM